MARVYEPPAASVISAAERHRRQDGVRPSKKASYKVVLEQVREKKKLKKMLTFNAKPPPGYTFIPAGDPQLTERCKQLAMKDGLTVHIVTTSKPRHKEIVWETNRVGYHFPSITVEKACQSLGVILTESGRVVRGNLDSVEGHMDHTQSNKGLPRRGGKKRKARDRDNGPNFDLSLPQATIDTLAREAIQDLFPKIPAFDLHEIIARSFQKGRDLVGTATGMTFVRRAQLAVVAHIRHTYTNYDELLRMVDWTEARRRIEPLTLDKLLTWRADDDENSNVMEDILREVIVISDDDEEDQTNEDNASVAQAQYERSNSVEVISADDVHTRAINLATDFLEPDSDELDQYFSHAPMPMDQERQHNQRVEDRMVARRHLRYEEALDRRRAKPRPMYNLDQPHSMSKSDIGRANQISTQTPFEQQYTKDCLQKSYQSVEYVPYSRTANTYLIPLTAAKGDYEYAMKPSYRATTNELNKTINVGRTSISPRQHLVARPEDSQPECYTQEPSRHVVEYHLSNTQQHQPRSLGEDTRFVRIQNPTHSANQATNPYIPAFPTHQDSDMIVPSVEGGGPNTRDQPLYFQELSPLVSQKNLNHEQQRERTTSGAYPNQYEGPPDVKRRRTNNMAAMRSDRPEQIQQSYNQGTVLIPLNQIQTGNRSEERQRVIRAAKRAETTDYSTDSRTIMLAPKQAVRYADQEQAAQLFALPPRGRHELLHVADPGQSGTLPRTHFQIPLSSAEFGEQAQFSHYSHIPPSRDYKSPISYHTSQVAPASIEHFDSRISLPHGHEIHAISATRALADPAAGRKTAQRMYEMEGNVLGSNMERLGLDSERHGNYEMNIDDDYGRRSAAFLPAQINRADSYISTGPATNGYWRPAAGQGQRMIGNPSSRSTYYQQEGLYQVNEQNFSYPTNGAEQPRTLRTQIPLDGSPQPPMKMSEDGPWWDWLGVRCDQELC